MKETKLKYYDLAEIKTKFMEEYGPTESYSINNDEYSLFCSALFCLPKDIVDKVQREVQFILLSSEDNSAEKNENSACYIDLEKRISKDKKAIIVLSPSIFKLKNKRGILHEVAHHILGSYDYSSPDDRTHKEKEVEKKVTEWIKERFGD